MALVTVLLMIAIISVTVIAFVVTMQLHRQSSLSYGQSFRADQLAQGGAWWTVKELQEEMSAQAGAADTTMGYGIYTNLSITNMMPQGVGTNSAMVSLVKTSLGGTSAYYAYPTGPYPNGGVLPSPVRTEVPSLNGRYVDATRWSEPCIGTFPTDNSGNPYWIMVTRSGPTSFTNATIQLPLWANVSDPNNYVIGRYAYAIYDEGGLININLAGYPTSFPDGSTNTLADLARKGSPGMMDLTAIPNLTTTQIQALIAWRNAGSEASATSYTNYLYSTNLTATNGPAGTVLQATNSFGTTNNYLYVAPGDNAFLSRQDLIAYAQANNMTNMLPYVTTYSRDVNAPSFFPASRTVPFLKYLLNLNPPAGGVAVVPAGFYFGKTNSFNPNIPLVRQSNGLPLVSQRFPLSRLALFSNPTANATAISNYFGLTLNPDGYSWTYNQTVTNTPAQPQIAWISQVATNSPPRSPNFFELIQAAVLQGSLTPLSTTYANTTWVSAVTMQMGANIIDQYTSDNWPTVINFNNEVYAGNKSLPYLSEFLQWTYRPLNDAEGSTTNRADILMVCPLEFWNPYQNAANLPSSGPTNLRVLIEPNGATNAAETAYWRATGVTTNAVPTTNTAAPFVNIATPPTNSSEIPTYFNYPANTTDANKPGVVFTNSAAYMEPSLVTNGAGTTNSSGFVDWTNYTDPASPSSGSVSGFLAGYATNLPDARIVLSMATNAATAFRYKSSGLDTSGSGGTGFQVQFQDANGVWHPYQGYSGTNSISSNPQITPIGFVTSQGAMTYTDSSAAPYSPNLTGGTSCFTNFGFYAQSAGFGDPRAYLWGMSYEQASPNLSVRPDSKTAGVSRGRNGNYPLGYAYPYQTGGGNTWNPGWNPAFEGMYNENAIVNAFASANSATWPAANSTNTYNYDVDGIIRPGDGYLGTNANPYLANNAVSFAARPIILNRPFRSVAEMGFAFRGQAPWKSINFFDTNSADMGLLDMFGNDPAPLVAGKINLNTRQPVTIQAAIQGAYKTEQIGSTRLSTLSSTESSNIASAITSFTSTNSYLNRADLVRQTSPYINYFSPVSDTTIKARREAVVRPLAELGTTRTWNLLIDVIAQVGHYTPTAANANSGNASLSLGNQFVVDGERRYWLHVTIDRVTGQVVDEQLELYNE